MSPQSLEKTGTLKGNTLDQSTDTPKKGMVVVRVQGGCVDFVSQRPTDSQGQGLTQLTFMFVGDLGVDIVRLSHL